MTLDQQMEQIRQGTDPKSVLRMIKRPEDIVYDQEAKEQDYSNRLNNRSLLIFRKLGGIRKIEQFEEYCRTSGDPINVIARKFKVSPSIVNKAQKERLAFLAQYRKVHRILKERGQLYFDKKNK